MKTDDLIAILGTRVEPVSHRPVGRMIAGSIAVGAALVVGAVLLALGMRPDLMQARVLVFFLAKLAFMIAVLLPASVFLIRLSRPGGERNTSVALLALPFIAVTALGAIALAFTPHAHWTQSLLGNQWLECLLSIPVIAIVPFAVIIWVVRRMAPTDLTRAGALSGLVAGTLSAIGYSLHCADDTLPFIALWYGGTIGLCTVAGALLGQRLLRW